MTVYTLVVLKPFTECQHFLQLVTSGRQPPAPNFTQFRPQVLLSKSLKYVEYFCLFKCACNACDKWEIAYMDVNGNMEWLRHQKCQKSYEWYYCFYSYVLMWMISPICFVSVTMCNLLTLILSQCEGQQANPGTPGMAFKHCVCLWWSYASAHEKIFWIHSDFPICMRSVLH